MISSSLKQIIAKDIANYSNGLIDYDSAIGLVNRSENKFVNNADIKELSGPSLWSTIHWTATISDLEGNREVYWTLLNNLLYSHPCREVCRKHLKQNLITISPDEYNSMFEHSVDLHNEVNRMLGKPEYPYYLAREMYNAGKCAECTFKF